MVELFQKLVGWRGNALLALRRARNTFIGVSFLITFFFAPLASKKKVAEDYALAKERKNGGNHKWGFHLLSIPIGV